MKKNVILATVLAGSLIGGGFLLMTKGQDAVSAAAKQKESLLTADQVNVSFQGVGGRLIDVKAKEEQRVKKGDVLMIIDPTDIDLQISKLQQDIDQMDVKIAQTKDSLRVTGDKISTQEAQARLGVQTAEVTQQQVTKGAREEDLQREQLAVQAAQQKYEDAQTKFNRQKQLYDSGAGAKSNLDDAQTSLTLVENALHQEQENLQKLTTGATKEEIDQANLNVEKAKTALTQTGQAREDLNNSTMNVDMLMKQKQSLQVQMETLQVQKDRLTLRAPQDGKIIKVLPKIGENVAPGAPVMLLETDSKYYDFYVDETQVSKFKVGQTVTSHLLALNKDIEGEVRFITAAPQFADLRMSREKGQADLSSFQIRVYVNRTNDLLAGMTVGVNVK